MNFRERENAWIVAEIGVNHEGSLESAKNLIHLASDSGVDAVKFQSYKPDGYISNFDALRKERVRKFALSAEDFRALATCAKKVGVTFFSTPLTLSDVELVASISPVIKIASGELTWHELIQHVAETDKPIIISTGLGLEAEIQKAVDVVLDVRPSAKEDGSLVLMHCVSAYPTPEGQANLANIQWLKDKFGLPVGYSDHTKSVKAAELAIMYNVCVIEKHFTDEKEGRSFRDHELSANPAEMATLVRRVRRAEVLKGSYERQRGSAESDYFVAARRAVAAAEDIPSGIPVKPGWLTGLRPMSGIPVEQSSKIVGNRLKRPVKAGDLIQEGDLE